MPVTVQIPVTGDYREIILPAGYADFVRCLLVVGDYLFLCTATTPAKLLKVRKDTFSLNWTVDFPNDSEHIEAIDAVYSPPLDRIYVVFANSPPTLFMIAEVNPNTGSNSAPTITNANFVREEDIAPGRASMTTDNSNLYVLTWGVDPTRVVKVVLSSGQVTLGPQLTGSHPYGWVIKYDGGKLYAYGKTQAEFGDTWVKRIDPVSLQVDSGTASTVLTNGTDFSIMAEDMGVSAGHLWVGRRGNPTVAGIIKKVDRNSFAITDFSTGINGPCRIVRNAGSFIWGLYDNGKAVRITPSDGAKAIYTLNDGQGFQSQIGTDADAFLYTAWNQSGTKIARYRIPSDQTTGEVAWIRNFGSAGTALGKAVAVDSSENIIVAGEFSSSTIDFGNGALINAGSGNDIFLAKFTPDGNMCLWSKRLGGTGNESVTSIALDANGNIMLGGSFSGTTNLGSGNITSAGGSDMFLVKLREDGVYDPANATPANRSWIRTFASVTAAGSGTDSVNAIAVDQNDGSVVMLGQYPGAPAAATITFGGDTFYQGRTVMVKLASVDGSHVWSRGFGCEGFSIGNSVAIYGNGDIVVAGGFEDAISFTESAITFPYPGALRSARDANGAPTKDGFIAKFSSAGTNLWSAAIGGPKDDTISKMALDASGNIFVTGTFIWNITLGGHTFNAFSSSDSDIFLEKLDSNGNHQWSTSFTATTLTEFPAGLACDSGGNVVVTGGFGSTINIFHANHIDKIPLTTSGSSDVFTAKFSSIGTLLWANKFGGTGGDATYGMAVDSPGRTIMTGISGNMFLLMRDP